MKVVLDTNFMALPFTQKVDVYELLFQSLDRAYELVTLEPCMRELKKLSVPAFELAKKKIEVIPSKEFADDAIVNYAKQHDVLVCTQDYDLRQRLNKLGIRVAMYSKGSLRRR